MAKKVRFKKVVKYKFDKNFYKNIIIIILIIIFFSFILYIFFRDSTICFITNVVLCVTIGFNYLLYWDRDVFWEEIK